MSEKILEQKPHELEISHDLSSANMDLQWTVRFLQSVCGLWGFSTPLLLFKSGGSLLKKGTIINLTKEKAINCEKKMHPSKMSALISYVN